MTGNHGQDAEEESPASEGETETVGKPTGKAPFFFGIHSIGVTCFAAAGTHHPVVVYRLIFQASSEWNASRHLGYLCLSCFYSLIKGISCDTS